MAQTFEELWAELKAEAAAEWKKIKAAAIAEEHKIVPVIEKDVATGLSQLKSLAIATVLDLAKEEFAALTGREKQGRVITTVWQHAQSNGIRVGQTDIQMLTQQSFDAVGMAVADAAGI